MPDLRPRDRNLRAADDDRDAVAETLREQHLVGRIDTDELQERIEQCYAAKTYAELDALLVDLPREDRSASAPCGRWGAPRVAALSLLPLLIVALALSHGRVLWLALPLAFFVFTRPLRRYAISSGACRSSWTASAPHSSWS